jgi:ABC-2 type transport system permease protein
MTGIRQAWLVAVREGRERSRSRGFQAGLVVMLVAVIAMIILPAMLDTNGGTKDVGLTGDVPSELSATIRSQGDLTGITVHVHPYRDLAAGEEAVRDETVDLLVVDARRLEWQSQPDEQLQGIVTNAIQLVAVQERAAAAGIDPDDLLGLMTPVPVESLEIGPTSGRSPDEGTAAILMTALLLMAIFLYGNLVLTGVVEEKSSRVVEVLLARMPARNLLAGKVAGIGLLGFAQFAATALVALLAVRVVGSVDVPAVDAGVLAWLVVWFVLGYVLYAMAYGALGALASRTEDAQSVAGPVGYVLIGAYWAAFLSVSEDPDGTLSRLLSLFPITAPFAMPGRIVLGSARWWEPLLAVVLTLGAIAVLVGFAGRVYTNAILHSGPTLRLRDAWHSNQPQPEMANIEPRTAREESCSNPGEATTAGRAPRSPRTASAREHDRTSRGQTRTSDQPRPWIPRR